VRLEALVVKPGETLIVRLPSYTSASEVDEMHRFYEWQRKEHGLDVKVLVVVGDELAVQEASPRVPGIATGSSGGRSEP
jgi:hypothetical protein